MHEFQELFRRLFLRKASIETKSSALMHDAQTVFDTIITPLMNTSFVLRTNDHPVVRNLRMIYKLPNGDKYAGDGQDHPTGNAHEGAARPSGQKWSLVAHLTSPENDPLLEKFGGVLGVPHRRTLYDLTETSRLVKQLYLGQKTPGAQHHLHMFLIPEEYECAGYPTLSVKKFRPGITPDDLPKEFIEGLRSFTATWRDQSNEAIFEESTVLPLDWRIAVI